MSEPTPEEEKQHTEFIRLDRRLDTSADSDMAEYLYDLITEQQKRIEALEKSRQAMKDILLDLLKILAG